MSCPLCGGVDVAYYHGDGKRDYMQCQLCRLVYVPQNFWLKSWEEKKVYDLHENDMYDSGYRKFLSRLADPLFARLRRGMHGLDFGCGPGPALVQIFKENGYLMDLYDPFFFPNNDIWQKKYDFICVTEVVEHLQRPGEVFPALLSLLSAGGMLGIMTKLVIDREAFQNWHYIRDLTHICFYGEDTFQHLAAHLEVNLEFVGNDVILLTKK